MPPSIPSSLLLPFHFPAFCAPLISLRNRASWPTLVLFSLPPLTLSFHPSFLLPHLHTFPPFPSPAPPSFSALHSRAKRRLSWPHASRSIGPIVYSLHPDTKDIKLTDQRAGARARLINEALGRGEEGRGRMDGARQAREEKRGGRGGGLDR